MLRNLVLLLTTAGLLVLLFIGYWRLTQSPIAARELQGHDVITGIAPELIGQADAPVQIANRQINAEIPPGQEMGVTVYDEHTGQPRERFRCESWRKVADDSDELYVAKPEITWLLPSGMIVSICADEGQISGERLSGGQVRPRRGWLAGSAQILVDRETAADRPPVEERPEDLITIGVSRIEFDLEIGEVRTDSEVRAAATEFELLGAGLRLTWNRLENRIERLTLQDGGRLRLNLDSPLGQTQASESQPGSAPAVASAPTKPPRRSGYRCELRGGVVAEQRQAGQRVAGLEADWLRLTFDFGGKGAGLASLTPAPASQPAPASAPSEAPASAPAGPRELVVTWKGGLALTPVAPSASGDPRRHIEAGGAPVTLQSGERTISCSHLAFHEETGRLWIQASEGQSVALRVGDSASVRADSVYLDRGANIIKLIGSVDLRASERQGLSVRCSDWAELHLAAQADAPRTLALDPTDPDVTAGFGGGLEKAVFSGGVRIGLGEQALFADKLIAAFRAGEANQPIDTLLQNAEAIGAVRLESIPPRGVAPAAGAIASEALALASVAMGAPRSQLGPQRSLRCDWLNVSFEPDAEGRATPNRVDARGDVRLTDRERRLAASGQRLEAELADRASVQQAIVYGAGAQDARVSARGYTVRGSAIEINEPLRTLEVNGRSRLTFRATRSLEGAPLADAPRVTVDSQQRLHVNALGDPAQGVQSAAQFVGQVVARSGEERLEASTLTLLLDDAPSPERAAAPSAWRGLIQAWRERVSPQAPSSQPAPSARGSFRKEPVRLIARDAVITSESPAPGARQPLVSQSVVAGEMEVDIRARRIETKGLTRLWMYDRRLTSAAEAPSDLLGLPSALLSGGPSQTVMECSRSMIYVLGEPGPQRHDFVIFDGDVRFVHATGREMRRIEEMLPELANNRELLTRMQSRNVSLTCQRLDCEFIPGAGEGLGLTQALQLGHLNALGDVLVRDKREASTTEVAAHQVQFDRSASKLYVLGDESRGAPAQVIQEDAAQGRFTQPYTGMEIEIDLASRQVRAESVRGRMRN